MSSRFWLLLCLLALGLGALVLNYKLLQPVFLSPVTYGLQRATLPLVSSLSRLLAAENTGNKAAQNWLSSGAAGNGRAAAVVGEQHLRIYIANLPAEYNLQVLDNYTCHQKMGVEPGRGLLTQPFGPLLGTYGPLQIRRTYMFALETIMHSHLMQSPLLVSNPKDADAIFVPFYVGMTFRQLRHSGVAGEWDMADALQDTLDNFWDRIDSLVPNPHRKPLFMAIGRVESDFILGCGIERHSWSSSFLCHTRARNITFLIFESFHGWSKHTKPVPVHDNVVTMVMPGHLHLAANESLARVPFQLDTAEAKKKHVVMQSFLARYSIRRRLKEHCLTRPGECAHYEPGGNQPTPAGDSARKNSHIMQAEAVLKFNLTDVQRLSEASWFCSQPWGDTPTRAQTMDCLLADGIPVFFAQALPSMMPFSDIVDWRDATVVLSKDFDSNGTNLVDALLAAAGPDRRRALLHAAHRQAHLVQWAMAPHHHLVRFDAMMHVAEEDDAFTAGLKAMMRSMCRRGLLPAAKCAPETLRPLVPATMPINETSS